MEELKLNTIEEAIADFREGKFVIVVDDDCLLYTSHRIILIGISKYLMTEKPLFLQSSHNGRQSIEMRTRFIIKSK